MAGCGGGDEDSAADPSPTKSQFVAQAGAICRDVKRAHQPFADKVNRLPRDADLQRVAPILEATLAESRKGLARLRALQSPAADQAQIDAYYGAAAALIEAHAQLAGAARANDRATANRVAAKTGALSNDERRLAGAYGLMDCENVF